MVENYQPTVLSGSNAQSARFGSSVVFGGDLDQNEFYDVIIGAPLEETSADSSGVIYVYYGSSKGLSEERKQVNFNSFVIVRDKYGSGAVSVGFGPNLDKNFWLILRQTRRF